MRKGPALSSRAGPLAFAGRQVAYGVGSGAGGGGGVGEGDDVGGLTGASGGADAGVIDGGAAGEPLGALKEAGTVPGADDDCAFSMASG